MITKSENSESIVAESDKECITITGSQNMSESNAGEEDKESSDQTMQSTNYDGGSANSSAGSNIKLVSERYQSDFQLSPGMLYLKQENAEHEQVIHELSNLTESKYQFIVYFKQDRVVERVFYGLDHAKALINPYFKAAWESKTGMINKYLSHIKTVEDQVQELQDKCDDIKVCRMNYVNELTNDQFLALHEVFLELICTYVSFSSDPDHIGIKSEEIAQLTASKQDIDSELVIFRNIILSQDQIETVFKGSGDNLDGTNDDFKVIVILPTSALGIDVN